MKLQKIKLKNIASYLGEHEIDFSLTDVHQLFAITGETGAGKSTILNAISLSLYGKTYKNLNQIDFVTLGQKDGLIQLWFQVGSLHYESFLYIKIKKENGEFLKKPIIDRSFYIINLNEKTKLDHVDGEKIIGLSFEQFIKTTILNQGQFAKFLLSNFTERKKILSDLYEGDRLDIINVNAKNNFNNDKKNIENLEKEINYLQSQNIKDPKSLQIELSQVELELKLSTQTLEASNEQFKFVLLINNFLRNRIDLESKQKYTESEVTQKTTELNANKLELDEYLKQYSSEKIVVLEQIENLKKAVNIHQEIQQIDLRIHSLDQNLGKFNLEIENANQKLELIHHSLSHKKISPLIEKALNELNETQLNDLKTAVPQMLHFNTTVEHLKEELKKLTDKLNKLKESKLTLNFEYPKDNLQKLDQLTHEFNELNFKIKNTNEISNTFIKSQSDLEALHTEKQNLNQDLSIFLTELKQIQNTINHLEHFQKHHQYVLHFNEMAKKSNDLHTCELCEQVIKTPIHLKPLAEMPTQKGHDLLKKEEENTKIKVQNLEHKIISLETSIKTRLDEIKKMHEILQTPIEDLLKKQKELELQIKTHQKIETEYLKNKFTVDKMLQDIKILEEEIDIKKRQLTKYDNDLNNKFKEIENNMSFKLEDIIQFQFELQSYMEKKSSLNELQIYQGIIKQNTDLIQETKRQIAEENSLRQQKQSILESFDQHPSFEEQLRNKQNIIINLENKKLQLEKQNQIYEKSLNEKLTTLSLLQNNIKTNEIEIKKLLENWKKSASFSVLFKNKDPLPETISLEAITLISQQLDQDIKLWTQKCFELNSKLGSIQKDLHNSSQNALQIHIKLLELEILRKRFNLSKELFELVGREEFKNFVLSFIESTIIDYTNRELNQLCNGRYQLVLNKDDNEIFVIDSYQDYADRKVQTLSGGETFLISLAMSLGLSEISRNNITIESFFIDEGFGQLDDDSLEEVIQLLQSLSAQGKSIGIISHIKKLTDRIPANLNIIKGERGFSEAKWMIN